MKINHEYLNHLSDDDFRMDHFLIPEESDHQKIQDSFIYSNEDFGVKDAYFYLRIWRDSKKRSDKNTYKHHIGIFSERLPELAEVLEEKLEKVNESLIQLKQRLSYWEKDPSIHPTYFRNSCTHTKIQEKNS